MARWEKRPRGGLDHVELVNLLLWLTCFYSPHIPETKLIISIPPKENKHTDKDRIDMQSGRATLMQLLTAFMGPTLQIEKSLTELCKIGRIQAKPSNIIFPENQMTTCKTWNRTFVYSRNQI